MPDYKEMYLKMVSATEDAMNILIAAQRECEEIYINTTGLQDGASPCEEVSAEAPPAGRLANG